MTLREDIAQKLVVFTQDVIEMRLDGTLPEAEKEAGVILSLITKRLEGIESKLVERFCERNGWEYGGNEDYDNAVSDVKWFIQAMKMEVNR